MTFEAFDFKKHDICPACGGSAELEFDDGYDENGQLTPTYLIACYRCKINPGKWHQPLDMMNQIGKGIYHETEPDHG